MNIQNHCEKLIIFLKRGEALGEYKTALEIFDFRELRIIGINIVSWFRVEAIRKVSKPMVLNMEFEWSNDIIKLVSSVPEFQILFEVRDNKLFFSKSISEQERKSAMAFVRENYKPKLMSKMDAGD